MTGLLPEHFICVNAQDHRKLIQFNSEQEITRSGVLKPLSGFCHTLIVVDNFLLAICSSNKKHGWIIVSMFEFDDGGIGKVLFNKPLGYRLEDYKLLINSKNLEIRLEGKQIRPGRRQEVVMFYKDFLCQEHYTAIYPGVRKLPKNVNALLEHKIVTFCDGSSFHCNSSGIEEKMWLLRSTGVAEMVTLGKYVSLRKNGYHNVAPLFDQNGCLYRFCASTRYSRYHDGTTNIVIFSIRRESNRLVLVDSERIIIPMDRLYGYKYSVTPLPNDDMIVVDERGGSLFYSREKKTFSRFGGSSIPMTELPFDKRRLFVAPTLKKDVKIAVNLLGKFIPTFPCVLLDIVVEYLTITNEVARQLNQE